jgi:hypothetical protein
VSIYNIENASTTHNELAQTTLNNITHNCLLHPPAQAALTPSIMSMPSHQSSYHDKAMSTNGTTEDVACHK